MKTSKKYYTLLILLLVVAASLIGVSSIIEQTQRELVEEEQQGNSDFEYDPTAEIDYDALDSFQLVEDMGVGWNLGNTLDSVDFRKTGINTQLNTITASDYYESLWGNPKTTQELIALVAEAGFGTVRIPVSYYDHMDGDYNIDPEWLDRVEVIVNYVLDHGMHAVINLHHEERWLQADKESLASSQAALEKAWTQIAERFKSYDTRLIFEGFNELLNSDRNWNSTEAGDYQAINQLNQTFVDTIRASSAYNKERFLMVATYGASPQAAAVEPFELPRDTITNHLLISVHMYTPVGFSWTTNEVNWTPVYDEWDAEAHGIEITRHFDRLKAKFIDNGIPVIIGEFAAYNKNNEADRVAYATFYLEEARARRMTAFWWDAGGRYDDKTTIANGALFDRERYEIYFPDLVKALTQ